MTVHDLITFCQSNGVEVSLGFDPFLEHVTVKLRRGNLFQIDYSVVSPEVYFFMVITLLRPHSF